MMQAGQTFSLPEGWFAEFDKKQNRYYFWNLHTKERTWTQPTGGGAGAGALGGINSSNSASGNASNRLDIPRSHITASSGTGTGLAVPLSTSCNISESNGVAGLRGVSSGGGGGGAVSPDHLARRLAATPPASPGGLGGLHLSSPKTSSSHSLGLPTVTSELDLAGSSKSSESGASAMDEEKDSVGGTTNKRQRAPTETLPDANPPELETGHLDPGFAPRAGGGHSVTSATSAAVTTSASSTSGTGAGAGAVSGRTAVPPTLGRASSGSMSGGSSPGSSASTRKNKLKGLMSMIGKKTSFSREKKRRENVIVERSASVEASSDREPLGTFFPKSPQTRAMLSSILKGSYVFQGLSSDELHKVVDMMCKEEVPAGHVLIRQGDRGDFFYVVESGTFDVLQTQRDSNTETEENKTVGLIHEGGSFGELALLYGQSRAATVRASADAVVWKLDRQGFRSMLRTSARHDIQEARIALRQVPLLAVLTDEQIELCADVVRFREFRKGDSIIRKGEIGDVFYIIKHGQVRVSGGVALKEGEQPSTLDLGPHAFFGERALLKDEARAANVVALTDVTCLLLDRFAFTSILGPLREVLDRNIRVSVFKQIELFRHLDDAEVGKVIQAFTVQAFAPGEYIIHQGQYASSFYVLRSGEAKVTQRVVFPKTGKEFTNTVGTLKIGDYFGEMALMENGYREASVIATSPCECFVLDRSSFEGLLGPADAILKRDIRLRREENKKTHKEMERQRHYEEQHRALKAQQAEAMDVDPTGRARRTAFALKDLTSVKTLGTGTFGRVLLVRHKIEGTTFALKMQSKAQIVKYKLQQNIINEKLLLATLSHPFIITLHQTFQDRDSLYMLLELVQGGELFSFLQNYGANLKRPHHIFYVANVVSAFHHLHTKHILYRDLKPENILIDTTGYLKLVDFGFAKITHRLTHTLCGTPEFFSPELVLGRGYGPQNDVWGLGILMYEIINGYTPFGGPEDNSNEICKRIVKQSLVFPDDCKDVAAKDLMTALLRKDPFARIGGGHKGITEIMEHPWFELVDWTSLETKQIQAPWVPPIRDALDTSLFDEYDENFQIEPYLQTSPAADWALAF